MESVLSQHLLKGQAGNRVDQLDAAQRGSSRARGGSRQTGSDSAWSLKPTGSSYCLGRLGCRTAGRRFQGTHRDGEHEMPQLRQRLWKSSSHRRWMTHGVWDTARLSCWGLSHRNATDWLEMWVWSSGQKAGLEVSSRGVSIGSRCAFTLGTPLVYLMALGCSFPSPDPPDALEKRAFLDELTILTLNIHQKITGDSMWKS